MTIHKSVVWVKAVERGGEGVAMLWECWWRKIRLFPFPSSSSDAFPPVEAYDEYILTTVKDGIGFSFSPGVALISPDPERPF